MGYTLNLPMKDNLKAAIAEFFKHLGVVEQAVNTTLALHCRSKVLAL